MLVSQNFDIYILNICRAIAHTQAQEITRQRINSVKTLISIFLLCFATSNSLWAQDVELLDELFLELQQEESWEDAETAIYDEFSRSGSAAMNLLLERGWQAIEAGDFRKAVEHLSALIDHAPDFAEGYNARATAFYLLGEHGLALSDTRQTLILNPRHFGALAGLGFLYEEFGDFEAAVAAYRAAEKLHPHSPMLIEALARLAPQVGGVAL